MFQLYVFFFVISRLLPFYLLWNRAYRGALNIQSIHTVSVTNANTTLIHRQKVQDLPEFSFSRFIAGHIYFSKTLLFICHVKRGVPVLIIYSCLIRPSFGMMHSRHTRENPKHVYNHWVFVWAAIVAPVTAHFMVDQLSCSCHKNWQQQQLTVVWVIGDMVDGVIW